MKLTQLLMAILGTMAFSCCSCVFNNSAEKKPSAEVVVSQEGDLKQEAPALHSFLAKASIRKAWQETLIRTMLQEKAPEAWILVTYGGYADRGQYAIMQPENGEMSLYYAPPNSKSGLTRSALSSDRLKTFQQGVEGFNALEDYRKTSFDGTEYEFLYIARTESSYTTKRVFMNSLGIHPGDDAYRKLVKSFTDLAKKKP